jgi:opacity protein-like surface antigen
MTRGGHLAMRVALAGAALVGASRAGIAALPPSTSLSEAPPPRFEVAVDIEWGRLQSGAYRLFTRKDSLQSAGLSIGYELLRPTSRLALTVGLGWLDGDEENQDWGGTQSASLDLDTYYAFGRASFALRPWLRPYASIGAGGTRGAVAIETSPGGRLEDDRASRWSVFGRGAVGLLLASRNRGFLQGRTSLAVSAGIELGLQAGTAIGFLVELPEPSDAKARQDRIPVSGAEIGSLPRTFPFWRMTFAVHF